MFSVPRRTHGTGLARGRRQKQLRGLERLETRNLLAGELLEVRLDAVALDGVTPVTNVAPGQEFLLRGRAKDLRPGAEAQGAFQVFTDVGYSSAEMTPVFSEVQRLSFSGAPISGTFRLTYGGVTSPPISFLPARGASQALAIQQGLDQIPALQGQVRVDPDIGTNFSLPANRYFIRFVNGLDETNVPLITANGSGLAGDPDDPSPVGVTVNDFAQGTRSAPNTFSQAAAYNAAADGSNASLLSYPEARNGGDVVNLLDNVGGGAGISDPPGASFTTYFLLRARAVDGGVDGNLVFSNDFSGSEGLELYLFGRNDALTAQQVRFTYGGSAADKLVISVSDTSSNTAPSLNNALNPRLATISEDPTSNPGTLLSDLLAGVSDPDAGAVKGVAVTYVSHTANGTWQYSVDNGSNWVALGAVSPAAAKLLQANASTRVRFVPNADFWGNVTFGFYAWDTTQGTAQGTWNVTAADSRGGTTAFSSAWENALLTVSWVNDAPNLNNSLNPRLATITEDPTSNPGTLLSDLLGGVSDVDTGAVKGVAVTYASNTANGTWQYSLNGGTNWVALGAVSPAAAKLLKADASTRVRFVPSADFWGNVTFGFYAWDSTQGTNEGTWNVTSAASRGGTKAFSNAWESAVLTVSWVNDAPKLNNTLNPTLATITEDPVDNPGTLVRDLLGGVSDVDTGATQGVAVTYVSNTANGVWQYSLDNGSNWVALGAVSPAAAKLLKGDATTRVRFVPNQDFNGTVIFGFYAWDQTRGAATNTWNVESGQQRGGSTPFSVAWESASLTITPAPEASAAARSSSVSSTTAAPVLTLSGGTGYQLNAAAVLLASDAQLSDLDSSHFAGGVLRLSITAGSDASNRLAVGGAFTRVGNEIRLGTNKLATVNTGGGVGTTDLVLTLTQHATVANTQQLLRSITFRTVGGTGADKRVVRITLSDGDGGTSVTKTRTVNVGL
jgi:hypothetical protein